MTKLKVKISQSNSKTGIPSFNTLPGNDKDYYRTPHSLDGERITGTCQCCCPGGYCQKVTRYPGVFNACLINTILVKEHPDELEKQLNSWLELYEPRYFRIHDYGEIWDYNNLKMWIRIAEKHEDTKFYTYTKRFDLLREYLQNGGLIPENLTINLSTWDGVTDKGEDLIATGLFNVFHYDDDKNSPLIHCPAVDKDGNRNSDIICLKCKRCMRKGNFTAVYPH